MTSRRRIRRRRWAGTLSIAVLGTVMWSVPAHAGSIFIEGTAASDGTYASGAQTVVTVPPQQSSAQRTTYFVFVAATLSDGTFFQAGWMRNMGDRCSGNLAYFAYAQDPNGEQILWVQDCAPVVTAHQFRILLLQNLPYGGHLWQAQVDGTQLSFSNVYTATGHDLGPSHKPWVQTELPAGTDPSAVDMPRVHFGPAVQWRFGTAWNAPAHGYARYSTEPQFDNPFCRLPYWYTASEISNPSPNHALAGDSVNGSTGCLPSGSVIW